MQSRICKKKLTKNRGIRCHLINIFCDLHIVLVKNRTLRKLIPNKYSGSINKLHVKKTIEDKVITFAAMFMGQVIYSQRKVTEESGNCSAKSKNPLSQIHLIGNWYQIQIKSYFPSFLQPMASFILLFSQSYIKHFYALYALARLRS